MLAYLPERLGADLDVREEAVHLLAEQLLVRHLRPTTPPTDTPAPVTCCPHTAPALSLPPRLPPTLMARKVNRSSTQSLQSDEALMVAALAVLYMSASSPKADPGAIGAPTWRSQAVHHRHVHTTTSERAAEGRVVAVTGWWVVPSVRTRTGWMVPGALIHTSSEPASTM